MNNCTLCFISNREPTAPYFTYKEFFKSLDGELKLILGTIPGQYQNLSDRPRILQEAIYKKDIDTKYTIFVDCWDLMFADSPQVVLDKHLATGNDITFSAEKNCFPSDYKERFNAIAPINSSYKYLNCGTIVGETAALLTLLESMDAINKPKDYFDTQKGHMHHYNEQGWYMEEFFKQPVKCGLDYYQDIANCMQDVLPEELDLSVAGKIRNIECNTYPSIIHLNGNSKTSHGIRELSIKQLNL